MVAESNIKPIDKYIIENYVNNNVDIVFFDNILEEEKEEGTIYKYHIYKITVKNRNNLEQFISNNFNKWLEFAKRKEQDKLADEIRSTRNKLLDSTDKFIILDYPISEKNRQEVLEYRQKLRDLPQQEGFPYDIMWPKKPNTNENGKEND